MACYHIGKGDFKEAEKQLRKAEGKLEICLFIAPNILKYSVYTVIQVASGSERVKSYPMTRVHAFGVSFSILVNVDNHKM